jgi:hypothetical protein
MLLRRHRPDLPRPYRMWLYPLPCAVALVGWLFVYVTNDTEFIVLGLVTLAAGAVAFLAWSSRTRRWPFDGPRGGPPEPPDPGPTARPGSEGG